MLKTHWRIRTSFTTVATFALGLCFFAFLGLLISGRFNSLLDLESQPHLQSGYSAYQGKEDIETFFRAESAGRVLTVLDVDETLRQSEGDYLGFVWFNLMRLPKAGERAVLLSRNRFDNGRRTSFSIALQGTIDGVRPLISSGNPARGGEWIPFGDASLQAERWYALVISQVETGFISVHLLTEGGDASPVLLGAHRITGVDEMAHKATIAVGAIGAEGFRGQIGAFGMLRGHEVGKHMPDCLEAILNPRKGPPNTLLPAVILWATPYTDMSPHNREIRVQEELPSSTKKVEKFKDHNNSEVRAAKNTKSRKKITSLIKRSKKKLPKKSKD